MSIFWRIGPGRVILMCRFGVQIVLDLCFPFLCCGVGARVRFGGESLEYGLLSLCIFILVQSNDSVHIDLGRGVQ